MKTIDCPLNGRRNISEFIHGGEVKNLSRHDHFVGNDCTDKEWADYVFYADNTVKVMIEWWLHSPSGYWFIAERHTVTDEIIATYDPSKIFTKKMEIDHTSLDKSALDKDSSDTTL